MPPRAARNFDDTTFGSRPSAWSIPSTLSLMSRFESLECSTSGNATFSKIRIESRSAAYW